MCGDPASVTDPTILVAKFTFLSSVSLNATSVGCGRSKPDSGAGCRVLGLSGIPAEVKNSRICHMCTRTQWKNEWKRTHRNHETVSLRYNCRRQLKCETEGQPILCCSRLPTRPRRFLSSIRVHPINVFKRMLTYASLTHLIRVPSHDFLVALM